MIVFLPNKIFPKYPANMNEINVAIAAPKIPYNGIKYKFSPIFKSDAISILMSTNF